MKNEELIHDILGCAYLAAHGDGDLADEEINILADARPAVEVAIASRDAVEHYVETGDLEAAIALSPYKDPKELLAVEAQFNLMDFGGLYGEFETPVPAFLAELYKARGNAGSLEGVTKLENQQAAKITDLYLQRVTFHFCFQVVAADSEIALGEDIAIQHLCAAWGIDVMETLEWCKRWLAPVLIGIMSDKPKVLFPFSEGDNALMSVAGIINIAVLVENDFSDDLDHALTGALAPWLGRFDTSDLELDSQELAQVIVQSTRNALEAIDDDVLLDRAVSSIRDYANDVTDLELRTLIVETVQNLSPVSSDEGESAGLLGEAVDAWENDKVF